MSRTGGLQLLSEVTNLFSHIKLQILLLALGFNHKYNQKGAFASLFDNKPSNIILLVNCPQSFYKLNGTLAILPSNFATGAAKEMSL